MPPSTLPFPNLIIPEGCQWQILSIAHDHQLGSHRRAPIDRGRGRGSVSPDHIHLLLAAPPILAPAKLAQYIKGRSSRHLQAEFPELRKQYWGQHMWARGYFWATVGAVDEVTIKAYLENQKWDEDDDAFKITAPT